MSLQGKGWFIWQIARCENGDPDAIANKAVEAKLTHVLIKVTERTYAFNLDQGGRDLVPAVAEALRGRGIEVWGWHYIYGDNPTGEAEAGIKRCQQLKLDGYVLDAEGEYKGKAAAARTFMRALRAGLPDRPLALSSFRYPSLHPQFPWQPFLEKCDLAMPQVYWEKSHNPEQQLERSLNEYANPALVGETRPYIPTGSAYGYGTWRATPEEVTRFLRKALELKLPAANLYSWDYAIASNRGDLWTAAAFYLWPTPPPQNIGERYLAALNSRDYDLILALYHPNAGHVTAERTIIGAEDLRAWYQTLLERLLPNTAFALLEATGTSSSWRVRWTATDPSGQAVEGDDTLGLREGYIQYHYTETTPPLKET